MAGGAKPEPSVHRVGDFILRRWLAQGGMAELYLASAAGPPDVREVVVLKRVLPQFSSNDNFVRMFAREAQLASVLRHPNIVEVHDAGGLGAEDCFFTMEYVHGADLGVLLGALRRRSGSLPLAHALTIAVAMCKGLHYAHEANDVDGMPLGIVHRDVSPSNVLIGFDGSVKITDFGVAKALAMTQLTQEGTRKGKLSYMSPEQATGEKVDRRADVFAIATVLYELTTMERLFRGDNDLAIMYNIIQKPRPRPRDTNPGYPAALEALVLRAVSHHSNERFRTALQLQQALEEFAASVGLTLSEDALGRFVRQTLPVTTHPKDDPELWGHTTTLRSAPQHAITIAEQQGATGGGSTGGGSDIPATQAQEYPAIMRPPVGGTPAPVGPVASASSSQGALPPSHGRPPPSSVSPGIAGASSSLSPGVAGLSASQLSGGSAVSVPPPPSSKLHMWSALLAVLALLVAVGLGVTMWLSRQPHRPAPEAKTSPDEATPAVAAEAKTAPPPSEAAPVPASPVAEPTAPAAASPAEPAAPDSGAQPAQPSTEKTDDPGRRPRKKTRPKTKKSSKSRPAADSPPPTPSEPTQPPSNKPSPTDTLLPIRE